jgi:hypothetical protein
MNGGGNGRSLISGGGGNGGGIIPSAIGPGIGRRCIACGPSPGGGRRHGASPAEPSSPGPIRGGPPGSRDAFSSALATPTQIAIPAAPARRTLL